MPQLDPTWFASQLFWLVIAFVTLYVILSRLVLPPLTGVIARRSGTIAGDIDLAQRFKSEAEHARLHYEQALADARERSQQIVGDVMLEHKQASEKSSKELDQQIAKKLAEAEKRIADKKQELITALTPTAAELAAQIVEKLTTQAPAADKVKAAVNALSKTRG